MIVVSWEKTLAKQFTSLYSGNKVLRTLHCKPRSSIDQHLKVGCAINLLLKPYLLFSSNYSKKQYCLQNNIILESNTSRNLFLVILICKINYLCTEELTQTWPQPDNIMFGLVPMSLHILLITHHLTIFMSILWHSQSIWTTMYL